MTALADRGALATALAVQQARVQPAIAAADDSTRALQEAEAVLQITMHFGLVHEAFCQASRAASIFEWRLFVGHARAGFRWCQALPVSVAGLNSPNWFILKVTLQFTAAICRTRPVNAQARDDAVL